MSNPLSIQVKPGMRIAELANDVGASTGEVIRALKKSQPDAIGRGPNGNYFLRTEVPINITQLYKDLGQKPDASATTRGSGLLSGPASTFPSVERRRIFEVGDKVGLRNNFSLGKAEPYGIVTEVSFKTGTYQVRLTSGQVITAYPGQVVPVSDLEYSLHVKR